MADGDTTARRILTDLEEGLATHDLDRMVELFTEDVVLIGDAEECWDRKATVAYLSFMADMRYTVRWEWDRVTVLMSAPGVLSFAAAGMMAFYDGSGQLYGDRERFRLTCIAVEDRGRWRLRHFHGSEPKPE